MDHMGLVGEMHMSKTANQFKLRIPADVKDWLEAQAEKNLRTQGNEIVVALREKMAAEKAAQEEAKS